MLVVRASSCKEGRYGIFLQLYTKVKAQPTWGSLSRSSALASADINIIWAVMAEWLKRWDPISLRLAISRTRDQINLWPVDQGYPHTESGKLALACEPATGWLGMVDCPIRHSVLLSVSMPWHGINIYRGARTVQWRIQGETPSWLAILTN